jgi:photosystem II stability/assembly factor-like uncharacterized protein
MSTLLVGTRKGLFTVEVNGARSEVTSFSFPAVPVVAATVDERDGAIYVGLQHGHFGPKLHRSTDGGVTFEEIATPSLPTAGRAALEDPARREATPDSVELLWSLAAGHPDEPGRLWCGTIPGALFVSDDRGESWRLVTSLWDEPSRAEWFGGGYDHPGIHSIVVDPRHAGAATIGVSCGGVWHTKDGGDTWSVSGPGLAARYMPPDRIDDPTIQDPHRVVVCAADPDVLWTQHHCGIFRSTDAGGSWAEVMAAGPSTFGFAVAVHPHDPDTAWFVPARSDEERIPVDGRLVVTRTRDGGKTFDVLTKGLPGEHAYDLVYRHALDVDHTGDRLALGSTTGGLWVSRDGGDSFEAVPASLPPINVVLWT